MNRNRILGVIAIIWGGAVLVSYLIGFNEVGGNGAYAAGQYMGILFGAILLLAGLWAVFRGGRPAS